MDWAYVWKKFQSFQVILFVSRTLTNSLLFFLQDLFPIFCMDFSDTHLAVLEWSGTFNNVHSGNVVIFKWMKPEPFANLSDLTFTCCRFIEPTGHLITGGHDKMVRWFLGFLGVFLYYSCLFFLHFITILFSFG